MWCSLFAATLATSLVGEEVYPTTFRILSSQIKTAADSSRQSQFNITVDKSLSRVWLNLRYPQKEAVFVEIWRVFDNMSPPRARLNFRQFSGSLYGAERPGVRAHLEAGAVACRSLTNHFRTLHVLVNYCKGMVNVRY